MNKNLYVDFHVLQTVPPSCINRDDTGSPKTAVFGGKVRARVSSQAWKHAMRGMFQNLFDEDMIGYRTKNVRMLLADEICKLNPDVSEEEAGKIAAKVLEDSGIKSGGDKKDVLFFISSRQIRALAESAVSVSTSDLKEKEIKAAYKEALTKDPSIDIVLFGRMAASDPTLNFDAAAQVAHAISTHAVSNEYDYFTAVDDCAPEDNAGAGHLGTVEYNSSTLYRYASVNVKELQSHLNETETRSAIEGFAEAFIKSMPTGKQNTFANRTVPDVVYVTIREDQPVNLVNAFEKPIVAGEEGYAKKSEMALISYAKDVYKKWVSEPVKAWYIGSVDGAGESVSMSELSSLMGKTLSAMLDESEGM